MGVQSVSGDWVNQVWIEEPPSWRLGVRIGTLFIHLAEGYISPVIVPIAKYREPSTVATSNRMYGIPWSISRHGPYGHSSSHRTGTEIGSPSWDMKYHVSGEVRDTLQQITTGYNVLVQPQITCGQWRQPRHETSPVIQRWDSPILMM